MPCIGVSKASGSANYERYIYWMQQSAPDVQCIDFSLLGSVEEALEQLAQCDGLLLTGGADIHPERYGKSEEFPRCSVEPERDVLEFALYAKAQELRMPVLGVCRGAQLINVALGGTLVIDIPSDIGTDVEHARIADVDSMHGVEVVPGSLLLKITGELEGRVNSAHHQVADILGEGLQRSAISDDGICEAIEWNDPSGKPFLLGVQWHPERMDYDNPFSLRIASHFAFEAESYAMLIKPMQIN
jgi:putative glutamine amidotransferase